MNNITQPEEALETDVVIVTASVVGAGAAPPTIPNSHKHVVESTARAGAGSYTITLTPKARAPVLLGVYEPCVIGTDQKRGYYTAVNPVTGVITIITKNNADAANTDLAVTDQIFITLRLRNSKVKFGLAAGG